VGVAPAIVGDAVTAEQERTVDALVGLAQAQVAATLSNADSHDTKALGLLAADLAIAALLLGNRGDLGRLWWASVILTVVSALSFAWTLVPRDFSTGPAVEDLYRERIGGSSLAAKVDLLDALQQAIKQNLSASAQKRLGWTVGGAVMTVAAALSGAYLLVVR
jgi:hypothetical protein